MIVSPRSHQIHSSGRVCHRQPGGRGCIDFLFVFVFLVFLVFLVVVVVVVVVVVAAVVVVVRSLTSIRKDIAIHRRQMCR